MLRPGGRAIVCTENLASWHNISALVLGLMPFSLTNISRRGAVGNPLNLASAAPGELEPSWFHTRVLTLVGLVHVFELHGFDVVDRFAAGYHPLPPRVAGRAARLDPRHAAFIGIVAASDTPSPHGGQTAQRPAQEAGPVGEVRSRCGEREPAVTRKLRCRRPAWVAAYARPTA